MVACPTLPPETEEKAQQAASETEEQARVQRWLASRRHELFAESLLDMSSTRPRHRGLDIMFSVIFHVFVLAILLLLPLYFTEALDLKQFAQTILVAPPPPPPPPPPAAPTVTRAPAAPKRVFTSAGRLLSPVVIPERVTMLKEEPLPEEPGIGAGVIGGVPGGIPGGQAGGVIGGIISGPRTTVPPAPTVTKAPIRVGGRVKMPKALFTPAPVFPALARAARVDGDVVIDAVIDTQGNVVQMQVVSGHPLLIHAAMDALAKWKYQPTILNDEAVSVQLEVTIKFRFE